MVVEKENNGTLKEKFDEFKKYEFSEILNNWHHLDENRVIFKNLLNKYLEYNFVVDWMDWENKRAKIDYLLVGCYKHFGFENSQIVNKRNVNSKKDFGKYVWENCVKKYYLDGLGYEPTKDDKNVNVYKIKSYVNATMILNKMIDEKIDEYKINPEEIVYKTVFKIVCNFHNNLYFDGKMIGDTYRECSKKYNEYWNDIKITENDFDKMHFKFIEKEMFKKENYENKKNLERKIDYWEKVYHNEK